MKKILLTIALGMLLPVHRTEAQAVLDSRGDTLGVKSTDGREVITISKEKCDDDSFSINVGGFRIKMSAAQENRRSAETCGNVAHHHNHHSQPQYRHYDRIPRNKFTIGSAQLGFIGLTDPDYSMYPEGTSEFLELNHGKSLSVSFDMALSFAMDRRCKQWFSVGLRPRWDNYVFDDRITLIRQDDMVWPEALGKMKRYKKSKMTLFSLDIPVMFEFNLGRRWEISAGGYGGFTLTQFTKVKFRKEKDKGNLGAQFFNAGLTLRVKYRCIGVFANYSLTPLFKDGAGPKTHPFSIGFVFF